MKQHGQETGTRTEPSTDNPTVTPSVERVLIEVECVRRITLAAWQNDVPFVRRVTVHNHGDDAVTDVIVALNADPAFCAPFSTRIDRIPPQSSHAITDLALEVSTDDLARRKERVKGHLWVTARSGDAQLARASTEIELLAPNEWPGAGQIPELLAAFVLPNASALVPVLTAAADRLGEATASTALNGYQSKDHARVFAMARAVYEGLQASGVSYVNPPASFETVGQKIRSPMEVVGTLGTCLDLSVVLCAVLEQAGLHPLLIVVKGHAFVGVWLREFSAPDPTIDDCALLSKRLRIGELLVFDSSPVASGGAFSAARAAAEQWLSRPDEFRFAVDICRARHHRIRPLPLADGGDQLERISRTTASAPSPVSNAPAEPRPIEDDAWLEAPAKRDRIERWKDRLLDLTLRNRLLNFRETARTFQMPGVELGGLEDTLASGEALTLYPRGDLRPGRGGRQVPVEALGSDGFDYQYARQEQAEGRLRLNVTEAEFEKRLVELYRRAKSSIEESGTVTLYLTLGMLQWFESESSDIPRVAPLILVPIALKRARGTKPWRIAASDQQTRFNSTLLRKLQMDFGLDGSALDTLPEDEAGVDVPLILNRVRQLIMGMRRWDVLDQAFIGQFSFTKYLMWLDLEARADALTANPIVRQMLENKGKLPWAAEPIAADRLDSARSPAQVFNVVDADPSQLQAILAASDGASFVLQGPPGTGKSQTITNLIAQLLADGKKVLFVSEKMAALNVVHDRLARVGLGPFCLELHSQKASKRAVMEQIKAAFEATDSQPAGAWASTAAELSATRDHLNRFAAALGAPSPLGGTVQAAIARLSRLRSVDAPKGLLTSSPTAALIEAVRDAVPAIERAAEIVGVLAEHPLRESALATWSPTAERAARQSLQHALEALRQLQEADVGAARVLKLAPVGSLDAMPARLRLTEALLIGPVASQALLSQRPDTSRQHLEDVLAPVVDRAASWTTAGLAFRAEILTLSDLEAVHARYQRWASSNPLVAWIMLWLVGPHRRLRSLAVSGALPAFVAVLAALEAARATVRHQVRVDAVADRARALLGGFWRGEHTDVAAAQSQVDRAAALRAAVLDATADLDPSAKAHLFALATDEYDLISEGGPRRAALTDLTSANEAWLDARREVARSLALEPDLLMGDFDQIAARLDRWSRNLDTLRDWANLRRSLEPLNEAQLGPLVDRLLDSQLDPTHLSETVERVLREAWWEHVLESDATFREFRGEQHDALIEHFRALDTTMMALARQEVRARVAARAPTLDAPGAEMALLVRQLRLKRAHMPLRKLFGEIPETLGRLKPCVLMSPLSVAQYLDPKLDGFDVVIFDEASQIPPWDAIGALARGRQAVVVGDSRQLPPTSFFGTGDGDDEADELDLQEMESILDEAASCLPERMLRWHYRSRHESLIAFSNHHYYDNRLNTFPSAAANVPRLGVKWRPVPGGVYDRGRSRTNKAEAQAVVTELERLLASPAPPTVGIVTFSAAQQRLIEDLVDLLRQRRADLESHFTCDEAVFVKNLENVQGDERDVMLFSVGYGPDRTGRVAMNFGPLNREGGERRLNVAITRARERLLVFSTLRADQIDLGRTRAVGVRHLKTFLAYAERGMAALDAAAYVDPEQETDSPFEAEVKAVLERLGHKVHTQVGCSGYRIDLAVVDPDAPGAYLLGVECDGATYHSAATARERDRLRQQVLESLGWRIHRIWSTDWWFRRDAQIAKLRDVIEAVQHAARQQRARRDHRAIERGPASVASAAAPAVAPTASKSREPAARPAPEHTISFEERLARSRSQAPSGADRMTTFSWPEPVESGAIDLDAPASARRLARLLSDTVSHCGPVYSGDAYRLVLKAFDARLTTRRRERLDEVLRSLRPHGIRLDPDGVIWPADVDPSTWRGIRTAVRGEEITERAVGQIPGAEIANAAEWVLGRAKVIDRDDLAREAGAVLGLRRITSKARATLLAGIDRLVAEGRVLADGERLRVID